MAAIKYANKHKVKLYDVFINSLNFIRDDDDVKTSGELLQCCMVATKVNPHLSPAD